MKALRLGLPLRAGVIDVMAGQRTGQAHAELVDLGVPVIGFDRLRHVGRGAGCGTTGTAGQLCGACGDGVALIAPDGVVRPCVMARWIEVGDTRRTSLDEALAGIPQGRVTLIAEGMPLPRGPRPADSPTTAVDAVCVPNMCDPQCGPSCSPACRPAGNCRPVGACSPDYR
ncbi:hypothetical protein [Amycolatopsis acidicola]|uniref:hypothetical protein n=1 Tax=Amycolatopsis acidicola TaxID=2596893 RepID=UPI001FB5F755|nr:hypothetical protein [Amycolatopsis acidicola]